jgi:tRNA 2-selenouridine synthase
MRSQAVVSLLDALGFQVQRLEGGYKAYRTYVLAELERLVPPRLIVVHGQTGVGKTLLLQRLSNALDLEDAAQHRSSLFGGINRTPRSQQHFEAHLLDRFQALDRARPVWVEGESRKVGTVLIPERLRRAMSEATCVLVTASLETRISRIVAEYAGTDGETDPALAPATVAQLESALRNLRAFFGADRTEVLVRQLRGGDLRPLVRTLLEEHYDPRYRHAMRGYAYALTVSGEDLDLAAAELTAFGASPAGAVTPRPAPEAASAGG